MVFQKNIINEDLDFNEIKKSKKIYVLPENIILDTEETLKNLISKDNFNFRSLNKINRQTKKILIKKYKKNDKNWFLTSFLALLLKNTKNKINYKKINNLLISSKFSNLYLSDSSYYKVDDIADDVNNAFKDLALYYAKLYSDDFYEHLLIAFDKKTNNNQLIDSLNNEDEYLLHIWNKSYQIFEIYIDEVKKLINKNINEENLAKLIAKFYSIKKELVIFFKYEKKHLNKLLITNDNYEKVSSEMMIVLDGIKNEMYFINGELVEEIISNLTELEMKIILSDRPALTPTQWVGLLIRYAVLIGWALIIIFPIIILIRQAFNGYVTAGTNEMQDFIFSFNNFKRLFTQTQYSTWLKNSILIALGSMIIQVIAVSFTAYAFSRFKFRGKRSFIIALLVTQMIPAFTSLLVYYIITSLLETAFFIPPIVTLLLIYTGGGIASNTIILKGYMDSISMDIDDAAKIDGCSHFWIFTNIIFPLCKPILVLIALMAFIGPFGDVILPSLILQSTDQYTVAIGLKLLLESPGLRDFGAWFAGSLFIAVPIVILFISLQKYIVSGLTNGGVKG